MQDWNYFYTNNFEITIEVACDKFEDEKKLIGHWKDNKYALLSYIGQVFGIVFIQLNVEFLVCHFSSACGTHVEYEYELHIAK